MQVNSISTTSFAGKTAKTKKGNEYEKTNSASICMPLISLATFGASLVFMKKDKSELLKKCYTADSKKVISTVVEHIIDRVSAAALGGLIVDGIINHTSKKDSDKAAEDSVKIKKTNKWKIIGSSIGAGLAGLGFAFKKNHIKLPESIAFKKNPNPIMARIFLTGAIVYTAAGAYIDYKINKNRDKLNKADKAAEAE